MIGATTMQMKCLRVIEAGIAQDGVSPTFQEIAERMSLRSKSNVDRLVSALEEKGFIARQRGRQQSLTVIRSSQSVISQDSVVVLRDAVMRLLKEYARVHGIEPSTAANELLREMLEAHA